MAFVYPPLSSYAFDHTIFRTRRYSPNNKIIKRKIEYFTINFVSVLNLCFVNISSLCECAYFEKKNNHFLTDKAASSLSFQLSVTG